MRKPRLLVWLGSALICGGAALLGVYWHSLNHAAETQQRAKSWLNGTPLSRPALPEPLTPPTLRHAIRHGDVLGELNIPRLNISVIVFEGDDASILKIGAGHIPGTAAPQDTGNVGIAAHRDTYFRPLRVIHPDDLISLRTPTGISTFAVTKTEIVQPSDIAVLDHAPGRDLTLVTCYPFSYIGHAPQRFIVHARKIG
jgi:sortase A